VKLVVRTPEQASRCAAEIAKQARRHERGLLVTIEVWKPPLTGAQNAKLHVLIHELADRVGYADPDELKSALKESAFWPHKTVAVGERAVTIPKSTKDLSREEASGCIEGVLAIAAEMGVTLDPSP
jgi:hypothetical protein